VTDELPDVTWCRPAAAREDEMGCDRYRFRGTDVGFGESDDTLWCLCTFPHNDGGRLCRERVRSLAYLGAAVALIQQGAAEGPIYLPHGLPDWVVAGIDGALPPDADEGDG
jgi:hypothetical protein